MDVVRIVVGVIGAIYGLLGITFTAGLIRHARADDDRVQLVAWWIEAAMHFLLAVTLVSVAIGGVPLWVYVALVLALLAHSTLGRWLRHRVQDNTPSKTYPLD